MTSTAVAKANGSAPASKPANDVLEIAQPDLRRIVVTIIGITPLICSNGKQALDALTADRDGRAKTKKITDPQTAFASSLYVADDGSYGFPGGAIQRALRDAAVRFTDKKGTVIAGAIRIVAGTLLPIRGSEPRMGDDYVRHGGRTPDIAYRGYFDEWELDVPVLYNAEVISEANVVTLFSIAGFSIGVGAWRPEKNGSFGQFEVKGVSR